MTAAVGEPEIAWLSRSSSPLLDPYGEAGDDFLYGQDGDDTALGGAGDDDLYGELGNDTLSGEAGNDAILGDRGGVRDVYETGSASETTSVTQPPAITYTSRRAGSVSRVTDQLHDVQGDAFVGSGAGSPMPYNGIAFGGNDRIRGGTGHDDLHGGVGDDLVNGLPHHLHHSRRPAADPRRGGRSSW